MRKGMKEQFPIIIAENDDRDVEMIQRGLRVVGFTNPIHISRDGQDVIAYLKGENPYQDRAKHLFPRILLLCLELPEMNGFELLLWLKNHEQCNVIPRIVLTRSRAEADVFKAYQLGVNSYIQKPPTFEGLVSKLQLVLDYWSMCEKPILPAKC
jgi:CheY-like chemotaxis protein